MTKLLSKILIFILLTLICNINSIAQSNFVLGNNVEQPSTDVWKSIKYGEIEPSLYTGTVNVSIPFYTYKDNDFEIPISFDYASNGFIPNTPEGTLGVDWRLNVGGSIAVEIRGTEDFASINYTVNDDRANIQNFRELHKKNLYKDVENLLIDGRFYPTMYCLSDFAYQPSSNWTHIPAFPKPNIYYCPNKCCGGNYECYNVYDAEPDIFHFNFMGYSGTFHMGYDNKIYVYNTNTNNKILKVEILDEALGNSVPYIINPRTVIITVADGYNYYFSPKEDNISNSITNVLSYKLDKIQATNGRQVLFSYKDVNITTYTPGYTSSVAHYKTYCEPGDSLARSYHNTNAWFSSKTSRILSSISISGNTVIDFEYKKFPLNSDVQTDTAKLYTIKVKNKDSYIIKQCYLSYKQNTVGQKYTYIDTISITGEGKYAMEYHNWNSASIPFPTIPVNDRINYDIDHWGYYNGTGNNSINFHNITQVDFDNNETIISTRRNQNAYFAQCGMLSKITYPTGGYSTFEYEAHDYSKAVKRISSNNFIPELRDSTGYCGGIRIKSIKNYLSNSKLASAKEFEYTVKEYKIISPIKPPIQPPIVPPVTPPPIVDTIIPQRITEPDTVEIIKSSGILLNMPRYGIRYSAKYIDDYDVNNVYGACSIGTVCIDENDVRITSSGLLSYGTTHIEYSKVIEKRSDGSKIEYNFTNSTMPSFANGGHDNSNTVCEGFCSMSGWQFLKGTSSIMIDPTMKFKLRNLVSPGKSLQAERGKLYRKDIFNADYVPKLLYSEIKSYDTTKILAVDKLPAYFVKEIALVPVNIENYNLLSESKIQYLDNVAVGENVSYTYNSHGQISSQTTVDSRGDTQITEFEYVTDLSNPTGIYKGMIDNNVLNYPLSEKIYKIKNGSNTGILTGGRKYTYTRPNTSKKALVRISQIEIYDNVKNTWMTDMKYQYDKYGNLLEREDRNGVKTCYVWGYDGLYPVAICENISLADAIVVLGSLDYPLMNGLSEISYLSLKNTYPSVSITRFDYQPLVGLIKVTDPSGKVTKYDYNATGKLKSITDDLNNLHNNYFYSTDNKK
jgi:YD repeat-containing protein